MEGESESRRLRLPNSFSQEIDLVNDVVLVSTSYKNTLAVNVFAEWQGLREVLYRRRF